MYRWFGRVGESGGIYAVLKQDKVGRISAGAYCLRAKQMLRGRKHEVRGGIYFRWDRLQIARIYGVLEQSKVGRCSGGAYCLLAEKMFGGRKEKVSGGIYSCRS